MSFKYSTSGGFWLWVAAIVLLIDRITKYYAMQCLDMYAAVPVFPGFNFILSFNKGAAFSFLGNASGWQAWLFGSIAVLVSGIILAMLLRMSARERVSCIALTLILGGALGNLWDRLLYGHVIDFIQLYVYQFYWPVFNIADSAITLGAIVLMLQLLLQKRNY